jgi:hypothetical protein
MMYGNAVDQTLENESDVRKEEKRMRKSEWQWRESTSFRFTISVRSDFT